MDIWLAAVLVAWLPIAAALALLIGRSVVHADLRARLAAARQQSVRTAVRPPVASPAPAEMTVRQRVAS